MEDTDKENFLSKYFSFLADSLPAVPPTSTRKTASIGSSIGVTVYYMWHYMATEKLSFAEMKKKIREHLQMALNIEDFAINFAKQEEDVWKVNVEFKERTGHIELPTTALFILDAMTGEVKEFKKGYTSTF